jgi:hypothetical protein
VFVSSRRLLLAAIYEAHVFVGHRSHPRTFPEARKAHCGADFVERQQQIVIEWSRYPTHIVSSIAYSTQLAEESSGRVPFESALRCIADPLQESLHQVEDSAKSVEIAVVREAN